MARLSPNIVVLGAGGMLGHVVLTYSKSQRLGKIYGLARNPTGNSNLDKDIFLLDVRNTTQLFKFLKKCRPCVIVNCLVIKNACTEEEREEMYFINGEIPGILSEYLQSDNDGSRLIQISSDGVFSGKKGRYTENDIPDPTDAYGQSKLKGENIASDYLTIRTSFVGPSLKARDGILDWFLRSTNSIEGHITSTWNGVSSLELAKFILHCSDRDYSGLLHLGGEITTKHDLLCLMRDIYGHYTEITPSEGPIINRSLISVRKDLEYALPSLRAMLDEMHVWYQAQFFLKT
jgi:dTDP-4-dehydrorhamnose reductase